MRKSLLVNLWNVVFFHLFTCGTSFLCSKCGIDQSCIDNEKVVDCQGKCFTAERIENKQKITWKGCMNGKSCEHECKMYRDLFNEKCQVLQCCSGEQCNKHDTTISQRRKRNFNNSSVKTFSRCFLIISVITSFFIFWK